MDVGRMFVSFFLFQRKENLLMYRVFSVMQLGAPSRKTPYLISIKHLASISTIFESSGDTQFAPQFLPRLPRIFIDFSRV